MAWPSPSTATPAGCRSPTTPSTGSSPEVLEHIDDDVVALGELARVLKPGGTLAVTVPTWFPEKICWALSDEYHAPFVDGGHVRIYTEAELRDEGPGRRPEPPGVAPRPRAALALLVAEVCGRAHQRRRTRWSRPTTELLVWDIVEEPADHPRAADRALNPVLGKSLDRSTPRKPAAEAAPRSEQFDANVPDVDGIVTAAELARHRRHGVAEWQLPNGMIPWFPGGHADPWNHVEAAMALDLGGRRSRGRAGLRVARRPPASRRRLAPVLPRGRRSSRTSSTPTSSPTSPPASGTTGCSPRTAASSRRSGRSSTQAIDFVLDLQTPRGEILWARHADGTPWSFALLTGSSSICHSLRCAIAIAEQLGHERPDWELSAGTPGPRHRATEPEAFAPKHRWAMDWYYPVLGRRDHGRRRSSPAGRAPATPSSMDGKGVRCVSATVRGSPPPRPASA